MEHQREPGKHVGDLFQTGKIQFRFAFELVSPVAGADGDGQGVHTGPFHKFHSLVRIRIGGVFGVDLYGIFHAGQFAQFGFHHDPFVVGIVHHPFGQFDVFFKRIFGAVDHDRGKTAVHAGLADIEISAVIQVQGNGQTGVFHGGFHQVQQVAVLGVFPGPGGYLQDQGRFFFFGSIHNALDDFHIVDVKGANGIMAFVGFLEHFFRGYKWHGETSLSISYFLLYHTFRKSGGRGAVISTGLPVKGSRKATFQAWR